MKTPDFILYTDGGSRNNPGPAGIGGVICDGKETVLKEVSLFLGNTTNNVAEYRAVVETLNALKKIIPKNDRKKKVIEVRMDSELVVKQLTGIYQIKEETLFPFFIAIWNLKVSEFPNISFVHVPREKNKHADRLANDAMDRGS